MKMKIEKEMDTKGWILRAYLGTISEYWGEEPFEIGDKEYSNIDDLEKDYPGIVGLQPPHYVSDPEEGRKTIILNIDINTGEVKNWPIDVTCDFHDVKIVDEGRYVLLDEQDNEIVGYTGYVPECVGPDGWGDYLEFSVNEKRMIPDWKFDQSDYNEIRKNQEEG